MYCSSTPFSFVKGRFALKPLTNPGVKLFCVQANCPTSCIDTGSCHKCLCFLEVTRRIIVTMLGYHTFVTKKRTKKENQCYTEVAQKSGKRFSYEIYYNRRNQIKTACSRICNKI